MSPYYRARRFGTWLLIAALVLDIPFFWGELRLAINTRVFDPDMFTLYGFFRYYDPSLFPHDYMADYYLSLWMPPGFRALQFLWAQFADPALLHRLLPIVLWVSCIPLVYFSARRLGGNVNAFATMALYMGSTIFIFRMTGGMPHGFGFPLMWWTVAALLSGRPVSLALATVAGAAFYPIITPVSGGTLACWLLFPSLAPAISKHDPLVHASLQRKLFFLGLTAVVASIILLPMISSHFSSAYGRVIALPADSDTFPETQNITALINPFLYVMITYALQNGTRLGLAGGQLLTLVLLGMLMLSILFHDARDRRPGSLKPFLYSSALSFLLSFVFSYSNAYRFAIYTAPILITLFLPLALRRLCGGIFPSRMKNVVFGTVILGYITCIARAEPEASGYLFELQDFQSHALEFISTLPKDTMIAGWPGDRFGRIVDAVPYVARRQVLVTWAGHAATHTNYVLTLRARMNAIVDAYLAHDTAPLIALRDQYHVDYLVVNEADFAGAEPPYYIEPFSRRARKLWEENIARHFIVLQLAKSDTVYSRDGIDIIDLHKL